MASLAFDDYRARALAEGYDEVLVRSWPAGLHIDTHSHAFALKALVVQGEMWLTVDGATRHLQTGDAFSLEVGTPHAEHYGAAGATYWVARQNASGAEPR